MYWNGHTTAAQLDPRDSVDGDRRCARGQRDLLVIGSSGLRKRRGAHADGELRRRLLEQLVSSLIRGPLTVTASFDHDVA